MHACRVILYTACRLCTSEKKELHLYTPFFGSDKEADVTTKQLLYVS